MRHVSPEIGYYFSYYIAVMQRHIKGLETAEDVNRVKDSIIALGESLEISSEGQASYLFSSKPLLDIMHAAHSRYLAMSADGIQLEFQEILERELYQSMYCVDMEQVIYSQSIHNISPH